MMMECNDAPLLMAAFMSTTLLLVNYRRGFVSSRQEGKEPVVTVKFVTASLLSIIANWVIVLHLPTFYAIVQKMNLVVMAMTLSRHCLAGTESNWLAAVPLGIVLIKECRKHWVLWIIVLHFYSLSCAMDILKRHGSRRVIVISCMLTIDDELWKFMNVLGRLQSWKLLSPQSVVKIPCSQGHFIVGNGDIVVPMTLILSLGNKLEHHVGYLFGCMLLKMLISKEPLPALVITIPSILLFDGVVKLQFRAQSRSNYSSLRFLTR